MSVKAPWRVLRISPGHSSFPIGEDVMNVHFILRDQLGIKPTIDAALLGVLIGIGLVFVGECRGGFEILHTTFCHKVKLASDSPLAKLS